MRRTVLTLLVWAVPFIAQASDGGARAAIDAASRKFEAAVAKGDAAGIARLYATDAEILPPGSLPVKGREGIEKAFTPLVAQFKKFTLKSRELHLMGNLAVEVGDWKLEDASGKGPEGKGVVIWKKTGGTWQLYRDIWNDNGSPAPAAPEKPVPAPAAAPAQPAK